MPAVNMTSARQGASRTSKTVTFTGAANLGAVGAVPLFTVTGEVIVHYVTTFCTTTLTDAATTATLALGVTVSTALFIAASDVNAITTGLFWVSTTPTANGIALPAAMKDIVITDNIIGTVAAEAVTGGVLRVDCYWSPLSSDGLVA